MTLLSYTGKQQTNQMQDEYLTRCVVDPTQRSFRLYSSEGSERVVKCDTVDEFMNVLTLIRDTCPEDVVAYSPPQEVSNQK